MDRLAAPYPAEIIRSCHLHYFCVAEQFPQDFFLRAKYSVCHEQARYIEQRSDTAWQDPIYVHMPLMEDCIRRRLVAERGSHASGSSRSLVQGERGWMHAFDLVRRFFVAW